MANELPAKIAFRAEHTDSAPKDRAQRLAQQVAIAHEQTKGIVAALMNQAYAALTTDITAIATAYATILSADITTVLDSGHLVITVTGSGVKTTALGGAYFQVLLDGVVVKGVYTTANLNEAFSLAIVLRVPVTAGVHTVALQWKTSSNSIRISAASIVEEHASLLLQEAI